MDVLIIKKDKNISLEAERGLKVEEAEGRTIQRHSFLQNF